MLWIIDFQPESAWFVKLVLFLITLSIDTVEGVAIVMPPFQSAESWIEARFSRTWNTGLLFVSSDQQLIFFRIKCSLVKALDRKLGLIFQLFNHLRTFE